MALLLPKSIFIHIPKTGGSWVRMAVERAGLPGNEGVRSLDVGKSNIARIFHCFPEEVDGRGRMLFAFVRHPFSMYQSYWAYKMLRGVDLRNSIDRVLCTATTFPEFVRHALNARPGWVSRMYKKYLGEDLGKVRFVGRQEFLADDLVCALRLAGESFDEEALRSTPPVNESAALAAWRSRCFFPPELREAVRASEMFCFDRLGYGNMPDPQESGEKADMPVVLQAAAVG